MNDNITLSGQSFLNKVVETTGSIENAFEMAFLNKLSLSDNLFVGQKLINFSVTNNLVAKYFELVKPATSVSVEQENDLLEILGIGTMAIGSTFIVG